MHTLIESIWWGLSVLVCVVGSQQLDPIDNMCVRLHHQSVVKNNTLYIDGGRETFIDVTGSGSNQKQSGHITEGYNNYLIAIDLSTSWDWKTNISEKALTKNKVPQTGTFPPNVGQAALFHGADSDDNFYLLGGTTSYWNTSFPGYQTPYPAQYSLWSYNISGQSWGQYDITFGSPYRPNSGSATEARDQGLAFYFNGQIDSGSELTTTHLGNDVNIYLEGMLVVDTNNQTARNLSTKAVVGDIPRCRGEMQYVEDLGGKGILVQIGGNQQSLGDTNDSPTSNLVPMNQIDVFDVSSLYKSNTPDGTWYKQNTSGDVPAGRVDFCLVLASSNDGSSHNIYMYGGRGVNGTTSVFFDEIWVLSLPSFTWNKIYDGDSPRYGHTCHRVGPRTMLTVGGAENTKYNQTPCDWETKGVGVFDLTSIAWGSVYDANAPSYAVPNLVASKIGSGAASMTQPKGGFDQPGLAAVFNITGSTNGTNASGDGTSKAPSAVNPSSSQPADKRETGPIVGGVIGGLALAGLLSTLLWIYREKVKRILIGQDLLFPFSEMGASSKEEKAGAELLANEPRWELSGAEKAAELSSPIQTQTETETARRRMQELYEMEARARRMTTKATNDVPVELPSPCEIKKKQRRNTVDREKPLPIPKLEAVSPSGGSDEDERTLYEDEQRRRGSSVGTTGTGTASSPVDEKTWI